MLSGTVPVFMGLNSCFFPVWAGKKSDLLKVFVIFLLNCGSVCVVVCNLMLMQCSAISMLMFKNYYVNFLFNKRGRKENFKIK